jgi:hypothetical protein
MGLNQVRIAYVLKKEDLIRAVQIIKQRYQSITQGKVIAKGLKISFQNIAPYILKKGNSEFVVAFLLFF